MPRDERDLGAMLHRVLATVLEREREILSAHELPMWDYVALVRLGAGSAPSQSHLAEAIGRDKTRVIATIDRLERRGLIRRKADPDDRRHRIIELTAAGRELLSVCRTGIRVMEQELLSDLPTRDRTAFLRALRTLDDAVPGAPA